MAYPLSATKLQAYQRCPQAYYWRYELGIKDTAVFAKAALGTALHEALAQIYQDWDYLDALPPISWVYNCWEQQTSPKINHCANIETLRVFFQGASDEPTTRPHSKMS